MRLRGSSGGGVPRGGGSLALVAGVHPRCRPATATARCPALPPRSKRYDEHGAAALDVNFVDASEFFSALFGSDRFEHLVRCARCGGWRCGGWRCGGWLRGLACGLARGWPGQWLLGNEPAHHCFGAALRHQAGRFVVPD